MNSTIDMPRLDDLAILFDLDGTLVDTAGDLAAAMNHVLAFEGLPILATDEVRHMVGFGAKAMLQTGFKAAGREVNDEDMSGHIDRFLDYYTENIDHNSRPFPDAIDTLSGIADRGARLAVCTNKREAPAIELLDRLGISSMFDAIVGGDTAARPKPDAAPVKLCMERLGRTKAVFVGDSDTDIAAARAADIPCVTATFGYGPTDTLGDGDVTFERYDALETALSYALKTHRRVQS